MVVIYLYILSSKTLDMCIIQVLYCIAPNELQALQHQAFLYDVLVTYLELGITLCQVWSVDF